MTIHVVSNSNDLKTALSNAAGGDTILMERGNYGSVDLSDLQYSSMVTLKSADPDNQAVIQEIEFENSSYITLDTLIVEKGSETGARLIDIAASDNIAIINTEIDGGTPSKSTYGIYSKDVENLTISDNYIHDVGNGMAIFSTDDVTVSENFVDNVFQDFYKFGGVTEVLFENNTGGGNLFPDSDAHADFLQFQGSADDVIIRGNVFLAQNNERAQGIFLDDASYSNVLIEDNIIYSGKINAIKVTEGSNITVQNNTLLSTPDLGHTSAAIIVPSGSTVTNNITTASSGGLSGANLVVQYANTNGSFYYNDLFVNGDTGLGVTLEDLRPVSGSLAESYGAVDRLLELLDGTTTADPVVVDDPIVVDDAPIIVIDDKPEDPVVPDVPIVDEPDVVEPADPIVAPAPITSIEEPVFMDAVYNLAGSHTFSRSRDVIEVAPDSSLALDAATIQLTFNADSVSGSHGIISKDASGYANGGNHFTSYIKDGQLYVRFQDGENSKVVSVNNINENQDYDLHISFGEGAVSVWLDGVNVGQSSFDTSWVTNSEFLQVGANGWASDAGESGFRDVFEGTITDVSIFVGSYTPTELSVDTDTDTDTDTDNPVVVVDPVNDTPDDSDGYTTVFEMSGSTEFSGKRKSVVSFDHDSDLEISEGTIIFSFESDNVSTRDGLISKDASGYSGNGNGGNHFSSWIDDGELHVRFQGTEDDGEVEFVFNGLENDTTYELQAYFDADSVGVLVNGQLIGEEALQFDLVDNNEHLQIGGLGWSSTPGGDRLSNPFDGTITDVIIIDEAVMTPLDLG